MSEIRTKRSDRPKLATLQWQVQSADTAPARTAAGGSSWRAGIGSSAQRGYGYAWQQARARFLQKHPLCAFCERDGVVRAATVVDHKTPHRGDMTLFWDRANWEALCKPHHDGEKQRREAQEGQGGWIEPKTGASL